jgi:hypothetical protein
MYPPTQLYTPPIKSPYFETGGVSLVSTAAGVETSDGDPSLLALVVLGLSSVVGLRRCWAGDWGDLYDWSKERGSTLYGGYASVNVIVLWGL